jgi:phosphoglucomutase
VVEQGHPEHREFREVLKRPNHRGIRKRDLAGETMSSSVSTQSVAGKAGVSSLAGKPAPGKVLIDVAGVEREFLTRRPDPDHLTRPSGTENIYKIYAESFLGQEHLNIIIEARKIVNNSLGACE